MSAESGNLSLFYQNAKNEQETCFAKQPFSHLSYQGYFGVSARNLAASDEQNMDVDIKSIKLTNFDPTKYRRNEDLLTPDEKAKAEEDIITLRNEMGFTDEEFLEELLGGDAELVFTDEL